jgi:8-amino-7-oxononanoate synthase
MNPLDQFCNDQLAKIDEAQLRRRLRVSEDVSPVEIAMNGVNYLSFAGNDYLGLRHNPAVIAAGQAALAQCGAGAGASRLVTGNHPLYVPLETKLADMKGKQAALVFGSGYLANAGTIAALVGEGDLILADKLVHACVLDGAALSGAVLKRFAHNDTTHAHMLLERYRGEYRNVLIVTESVFSMDGDLAPLSELSTLAKQQNCWLMVDDAHGLFTKPSVAVDIWMGTLSKAVGAYGGYIAASQTVVDFVINRARSFIFSTGLPAPVCASALAALNLVDDARRERPLKLARMLTSALNLPEAQSAIVPIIVGSAQAALALSEKLKSQGIYITAIRPPTVPPNTARLRITFSAVHTEAQVERLIAALKEEM